VDYAGVDGSLAMEAHWRDCENTAITDCNYVCIGR
jgi:hypothetical protein